MSEVKPRQKYTKTGTYPFLISYTRLRESFKNDSVGENKQIKQRYA